MASKTAPKKKVTKTSEARKETRSRNASPVIDFNVTMTPAEMTEARNTRQTPWVRKFDALADAVLDGDAESDIFYLLGTFVSPNGAAAVARKFRAESHLLPCSMAIEARTVTPRDNGVRSELWAAVAGDALLAEWDENEPDEDGE